MSVRKSGLFFFFLLLPFLLSAEQSERSVNLGIEFGTDFYSKEDVSLDHVRRGHFESSIDYMPWHIGIMPEFLFCNNVFGLSSGVRITNYVACYGNGNDPFYWLISESQTQSNYVGLKLIEQSNMYVGVPLELRAFTAGQHRFFRPYFKCSMSFNFLISSKNFIDFQQDKLEDKYFETIDKELGSPEKFNSTLAFAFGFRFGRDKFFVNTEIHYPTIQLTDSPISFFDDSDLNIQNIGFQISFQFPLSGNRKSSSSEETPEILIEEPLQVDVAEPMEKMQTNNELLEEEQPLNDEMEPVVPAENLNNKDQILNLEQNHEE